MRSSHLTKAPSTIAEVKLSDVDRSDPWETIRRGCRLISSKVGLIKQIGHGVHHSQDPNMFALGIYAADLSRWSDIQNTSKGGGGGEELVQALAATIGEAVERYCMYFFDKATMTFASYNELGDDAVAPDRLRLHSAEQTAASLGGARLDYFSEDAKTYWVWGWSLTERRPRLVPAPLVYLGYGYDAKEAAIGRNASSGLAAGLTREEAILTALQELIERDAFTIAWLHRRLPRRLRVDDPDLMRLLTENFHADHPRVDLQFFDITLDLPIPTAFVVMRRPTEFGPVLSIGSACRIKPRDAVRKCLREAGQTIPYFRFLNWELRDWEPRDDFTDITSFDQHCVLYLKRPELVEPALSFCRECVAEVNLSEIADGSTGRVLTDVQYVVDTLKLHGLEVIVVDITTPDIESLGMCAVRVLVPGLVPLHGNHNLPFLGVERLSTVPHKLNWTEQAIELPTNQYPHPSP